MVVTGFWGVGAFDTVAVGFWGEGIFDTVADGFWVVGALETVCTDGFWGEGAFDTEADGFSADGVEDDAAGWTEEIGKILDTGSLLDSVSGDDDTSASGSEHTVDDSDAKADGTLLVFSKDEVALIWFAEHPAKISPIEMDKRKQTIFFNQNIPIFVIFPIFYCFLKDVYICFLYKQI